MEPLYNPSIMEEMYDPSFTAEITSKMQVPKRIRVAGQSAAHFSREPRSLLFAIADFFGA